MTGTLEIFKTEITPEKNAIVEDIHEYLHTKCIRTYEAPEFQYQQIELNDTFTIAAPQANVSKPLGNYCCLTQDAKRYYYFIINATWTAVNTVKLVVSMDTLNTFSSELEFSDKTSIEREHEQRLGLVNIRNRKPGLKDCYRRVDREPENLVLPKTLISTSSVLETENLNWYLIYKTREGLTPENISNPIQCSLIANQKLPVAYNGGSGNEYTFTPGSFGTDKYYYLSFIENTNASVKITGLQTVLREFEGRWPDTITKNDNFCISAQAPSGIGNKLKALLIYSKSNKIYVECDGDTLVDLVGASTRPLPIEFTCDKLVIKNLGQLRVSPIKYGYENIPSIPNVNYYDGTQKAYTISIEDLDKTDPKLMKVIRLPYAPVEVIKNEQGLYQFPAGWSFKDGLMNLDSNNLSAEFLNNIGNIDISDEMLVQLDVSPKSLKNTAAESKLYNSEFYTVKGLYDSFDKELKLENFSVNSYGLKPEDKIEIPVSFKPTNTINSKFAFKFDLTKWRTGKKFSYTSTSDYDEYMLVSRNNEESIFNNNYINYINNGYNYDKKQKSLALAQNISSIVLGGAQVGTTIGVDRYSAKYRAGKEFDENPMNRVVDLFGTRPEQRRNFIKNAAAPSPFLSAAAISAGFGAANGVVNTIIGQKQAQNTIDQKLKELSEQSTAVSGSDDVDLLQFYNDNKLKVQKYSLPDLQRGAVYDLFYFTGYNHPCQAVPDLNTRYWFNYIQCNPIFKHENTSIYTVYLDDIKTRFSRGATVYHHHPEIDVGWDIEQEYENYENNILDTSYIPVEKCPSITSIASGFTLRGETFNWTLNQNIDSTYQAIEIVYYDSFGMEVSETTHTDQGNYVYIENIDLAKPIKGRVLNKFNEALSSDFEELPYTR